MGRASLPRILATAVLVGVTMSALAAPRGVPTAEAAKRERRLVDPNLGIQNLDHLVFIVQENRSFDHYFGTFPGADGLPRRNDGSFAVCVPDPMLGHCRKVFHDTGPFDRGGPHGLYASRMDVDHGSMDGFIKAAETFGSLCKAHPHSYPCRQATSGPNGAPDVMGYHTGADIPNYWAYAKGFTLQDHMFAPADSWTLPSHLYLVSAWSATCPHHTQVRSCVSDLERPGGAWVPADGAPRPYLWADITWLLHQQGVSWAYYVGENTCVLPPCRHPNDSTVTPWFQNPLPGFTTVEQTDQFGNIRAYDDLFTRAADGTLPAVSWVMSTFHHGEHPPDDLRNGQAWVTRVVNAIAGGDPDQWEHTAIFLTWDDWGGFYDHMPPVRIDENGYGIRVPGILISPYARRGIDHQVLSFDAYLKLIEDRFLGGQRLDPMSDGWFDPRPTVREDAIRLGDLANEFDWSQQPLPPPILERWPSRGAASR